MNLMANYNLIYVLIGANVIVSFIGFRNPNFMIKNMFHVGAIRQGKQYYRIITSAFLHGNTLHLFFNMFSLYSFGSVLEYYFGSLVFLIFYFLGLVGSEIYSLYVHKNTPNYTAVGASGAVTAIIFTMIAFFPTAPMSIYFIPNIPAWLFGIVYTLASIYGIKDGSGRIGHSAHLGGGICGILLAICFEPTLIFKNTLPILGILIPFLVFTIITIRNPNFLDKHKQ